MDGFGACIMKDPVQNWISKHVRELLSRVSALEVQLEKGGFDKFRWDVNAKELRCISIFDELRRDVLLQQVPGVNDTLAMGGMGEEQGHTDALVEESVAMTAPACESVAVVHLASEVAGMEAEMNPCVGNTAHASAAEEPVAAVHLASEDAGADVKMSPVIGTTAHAFAVEEPVTDAHSATEDVGTETKMRPVVDTFAQASATEEPVTAVVETSAAQASAAEETVAAVHTASEDVGTEVKLSPVGGAIAQASAIQEPVAAVHSDYDGAGTNVKLNPVVGTTAHASAIQEPVAAIPDGSVLEDHGAVLAHTALDHGQPTCDDADTVLRHATMMRMALTNSSPQCAMTNSEELDTLQDAWAVRLKEMARDQMARQLIEQLRRHIEHMALISTQLATKGWPAERKRQWGRERYLLRWATAGLEKHLIQ